MIVIKKNKADQWERTKLNNDFSVCVCETPRRKKKKSKREANLVQATAF